MAYLDGRYVSREESRRLSYANPFEGKIYEGFLLPGLRAGNNERKSQYTAKFALRIVKIVDSIISSGVQAAKDPPGKPIPGVDDAAPAVNIDASMDRICS